LPLSRIQDRDGCNGGGQRASVGGDGDVINFPVADVHVEFMNSSTKKVNMAGD